MMSPRSVLLIALLVAGCSKMPSLPAVPSLTPYKMDIQQGNVVTQEMLEKLKPGMTTSQVRFILGTPLVVDAFHKDRWDYVYSFSKAGTLQEYRRIVVVFRDDKLERIEGDVTPGQRAGAPQGGAKIDKPAAAAAKPAPATTAPEPAATVAPDAPKPVAVTGEPAAAAGEPAAATGEPAGGADGGAGMANAPDDKPKEDKPQQAQ